MRRDLSPEMPPQTDAVVERCVEIVCSALSALGSIYIVVNFRARRARRIHIDVVSHFVHALAWIDLFGSIVRVSLELLLCAYEDSSAAAQRNSSFGATTCDGWREWSSQALCAALQFTTTASILWHIVMASSMFTWVVRGADPRVSTHRFCIYGSGTAALAALLSCLPFLGAVVLPLHHHPELRRHIVEPCPVYSDFRFSIQPRPLLIMSYFAWLVLAIAVMAVSVVVVQCYAHHRRTHHGVVSHRQAIAAYNDAGRVMALYVTVYLVFRLASVVESTLDLYDVDPYSTNALVRSMLFVLHSIVIPLTGFANAAIYAGLAPSCCRHEHAYVLTLKSTSTSRFPLLAPPVAAATPTLPLADARGHVQLFVTSFDLCKLSFPAHDLKAWLPPGFDVYVVGLQNCVDADDAHAAILAHLNRLHEPVFASFVSIAACARRAMHDSASLVVQFVFAKQADVAMGSIGLDGDATLKSSAKHVAGSAIVIFDATVSFATCCLKPFASAVRPESNSDSMHLIPCFGQDDDDSLSRKIQEAAQLLRSFETLGLDLPHQFDHTILGGHLAFGVGKISPLHLFHRLEGAYDAQSRVRVLDEAVASIDGEEKSPSPRPGPFDVLVDDDDAEILWRAGDCDSMLALMRHVPDEDARVTRQPSALNLWQDIKDATDVAETEWSDVVECDNLRSLMASNDVFCGFAEPEIHFLPSYPRNFGVAAAYNSTDLPLVFADSDMPSYADRILHHSLPGVENRLTPRAYYLCEHVTSSTHKPICSTFRLEVNRLHGFVNHVTGDASSGMEDDVNDTAASTAPRLQEFCFTLQNLDVNLWQPSQRVRRPSVRSSSMCMISRRSFIKSKDHPQVHAPCNCAMRSKELLHAHRFQMVHGGLMHWPKFPQAETKCDKCAGTGGNGGVAADDDDDDDNEPLGIHPIEPVKISVVFPLPLAELQRHRHQVYQHMPDVHPTKTIPSSSSISESTWGDALARGVTHVAVARAAPMLHLAVQIQGMHGHGGAGVLALSEADVGGATKQVDVPLTWAGKHTGYLHLDVAVTTSPI
ncbi:Aste57867_22360 [Aphanomyces stellatus]|uniref:Aste57867_22360 protein n=1 Tax=Aphanomyces stellatus TaxID=120398 RepID=A0A485LPT9_9STRA|nr:hypothetical protein As57867_022290 [Aphanomyces stellatus]VFT99023.1 Aste57867_22360 [Aphanomyces stellatus]